MLIEEPTGRGQMNAPGYLLKERQRHGIRKRFDLVRNRGLAEMKGLRSTRKTVMVCYRFEDPQLVDRHPLVKLQSH